MCARSRFRGALLHYNNIKSHHLRHAHYRWTSALPLSQLQTRQFHLESRVFDREVDNSLLSLLNFIRSPVQYMDDFIQKIADMGASWIFGIPIGYQLAIDHVGAYGRESEKKFPLQDFSTMNCVAPRRSPRSRVNNSGTSGNIGVMTKLREEGWFDEAMEIVDKMDKQGMEITNNVLLCLLAEAIKRKDLKQGKELHRLTKNHNLESDTFLGTFFIRFYTLFGMLGDAIEVFNKVTDRSVYTWSAMILAHSRVGKPEDGLVVYHQMLQDASLKPEENIFVAALEACTTMLSLDKGKEVHKCISEHGLTTNVNIGCALIDMYTRCDSFDEARKVFERLPKRELVVWNSMISCYAHFNRIPEALRLVQVMQQERLKPNDTTFVTLLKACADKGSLEQGKLVHAQITQSQYDTNLVVASALVEMYAKFGHLEGFHASFNKLRYRDAGTWSAVVSGYIQLGHHEDAIQAIPKIQQQASLLSHTFVSLLKALPSLKEVKHIHARALGGVKMDPDVGVALVDAYCKCNNIAEARQVFEKWTAKPLGMWKTLIQGYAQGKQCNEALELLKRMTKEGFKPSEDILVCLLDACTELEVGKQIHVHFTDSGLQLNSSLEGALANMYERCNNVMQSHGC